MVGHDPRDGGRDPRLTNWSTDRWMNICDFLVRRLWPAEKVDRTQRNFGLNFLVSRFCGGQVSSKVVPTVSSSASSSWFSSETETKPRAVDSWRLDEAISLARRVEPMKQWRCLIFLVRYATNLGRPAVCDISKHSSEIRRPISVPPLGGRLFIDEPSIGHRTASCTAVGRWLPRFFFPLRFTQFGVSWLFFILFYLRFNELRLVSPHWIRVFLIFLIHLSMVLLGFTGFYWVLLGFTRFYRVLLGFTVFYCVLLCSTVFYWTQPGITGYYWVLRGFIWFYWFLLGFTGFCRFYWIFTWFNLI